MGQFNVEFYANYSAIGSHSLLKFDLKLLASYTKRQDLCVFFFSQYYVTLNDDLIMKDSSVFVLFQSALYSVPGLFDFMVSYKPMWVYLYACCNNKNYINSTKGLVDDEEHTHNCAKNFTSSRAKKRQGNGVII